MNIIIQNILSCIISIFTAYVRKCVLYKFFYVELEIILVA